MNITSVIAETQRNVPDCLAVGLVDMTTGMLLDVKTVDSHPQSVLDLVAAATSDIYQGPNVTEIENAFKRARGLPENDGTHYFQDIIITSTNLLHVFLRSKSNQNIVMVVVCRKSANMGMVISKSRLMMPKIEKVM